MTAFPAGEEQREFQYKSDCEIYKARFMRMLASRPIIRCTSNLSSKQGINLPHNPLSPLNACLDEPIRARAAVCMCGSDYE